MIMEIKPILSQILGEVIEPIVAKAVGDAFAKMPSGPSGDLIKVSEACKMLRCSEPTFYDHVHKNQIKLIKNGHSSLVDRQKLLEDLENGKLKFRRDKHRTNAQ